MRLFKKIRFVLLLIIFALIGAGKAWLDHSLNWHLDQLLLQLKQAQVHYKKARSTWNLNVEAQNVNLKLNSGLNLFAEHIQLTPAWQFAHSSLYQDQGQLTLTGLALSESGFEKPHKSLLQLLGYGDYHADDNLLHSLGYPHLQGSAQFYYQQTADQTLQFNLSVQDKQLGLWKLQLIASPLHWQQLPQQFKSWQQIQWQQAQLSFTPGALWLPLLDALAQKQGVSLPALQTALQEKITQDLRFWLPQQNLSEIKAKLEATLKQGQTLALELKPQQSLSVAQLYQLPLPQWAARLQARLQ